MYRIKTKKDGEGNDYYRIQKRFFIFWFTVAEYGNYEHTKIELKKLMGK
jgi:hypothetical protein